MAKKQLQLVYRLFPSVGGNDLYTVAPSFRRAEGGKFVLSNELSQKELKYLYELGHTNIVYIAEG